MRKLIELPPPPGGLIADQSVRAIDLEGRLIRELTRDPSRNYEPITRG